MVTGDCLFPDHKRLGPDANTLFFMAEDYGLCTHYPYHKQKLVLFLSAMRSHADEISKNHAITYTKLERKNKHLSYEEKLKGVLTQNPKISEIVTYDIEDHFFADRIRDFCKRMQLLLTLIDSPSFIRSKGYFKKYNERVKKPFMHTFYQQQRKDLDILVDGKGQPLHGQWSFDLENRKKLPKNIKVPDTPKLSWTEYTYQVAPLVEELFPDHPGTTKNFSWATTRADALYLLERFLADRLQYFGPYEDAIDKDRVFIFHSVLSPYINMGLISPEEVVQQALEYARKNDTHYPSVEGFVRQIIGWREFIRGIYHEYDDKLDGNYFGHQRKMKGCWYDGTTGIPPLDDVIQKAEKYAYTHHIERLMVLGNLMLLCEIDPKEVYKWFMQMYVDSADWVMTPNVYGMSQYADGGIFATKPYIGGANYIKKMSNYPSGEWEEVVNGLYWRFIDQNLNTFAKNQRMSMMVSSLKKMDPIKRERLFNKANAFIEKVTV